MPLFALVDANSFYCSCERVFNPQLAGVPVVVLSNNDGNVIAYTPEAKAAGIKMGEPFFKVRDLMRAKGVRVYSSNYALYADMSARLVTVLRQFVPHLEVYSIDECFLSLDGFEQQDLIERGRAIRDRVLQWTGLPVCVGIGETKTRAKLANHFAKSDVAFAGVCDLRTLTDSQLQERLAGMALNDVWGVGRRLTPQLEAMGIHNALDLRDADARDIGRRFSVVLERTVQELKGVSCLALEEIPPPRKQIVVSRSFGERVESLEGLQEAVTAFASRAAEKLRREGATAAAVAVFAHTSPFRPDQPTYSAGLTVPLVIPSDDTRQLAGAAALGLRAMYKPGFRYAKAGVMLLDLAPKQRLQGDLWCEPEESGRSFALMNTLDRINKRMGRGAIALAGAGIKQHWRMQRRYISPAYTTRWEDLPRVWAR